jgi:hypothetical protein
VSDVTLILIGSRVLIYLNARDNSDQIARLGFITISITHKSEVAIVREQFELTHFSDCPLNIALRRSLYLSWSYTASMAELGCGRATGLYAHQLELVFRLRYPMPTIAPLSPSPLSSTPLTVAGSSSSKLLVKQ